MEVASKSLKVLPWPDLRLTRSVSRRRDQTQRHPIQDYLADEEDSRLSRRLAGESTLVPLVIHHTAGIQGPFSRSFGTSRLVADSQATTTMGSLAALTDAPTMPSSESLSSSIGARQLDHQRILSLEHDALVIAPPSRPQILECPFDFLFCFLTFSNITDWFKHSLVHFQTPGGYNIGPPTHSECCFCDYEFQGSPQQCWQDRMSHVAVHHELSHTLAHARPNFPLYRYLWENGLMSDVDYRQLRGNRDDPPVAQDKTDSERAYPSPPQSPHTGRARVLEGGFQETYSGSRRRREERQRRR